MSPSPSPTASPSGWLEWERLDAALALWPIGAGKAGYVGFGGSACREPRYDWCDWISPYFSQDGRSWRVATAAPETFRDARVFAVREYQDGFVAMGTIWGGDWGQSATAAAWISADGQSWTKAAVDGFDVGLPVSAPCKGGVFTGAVTGGMHDAAVVGDLLISIGEANVSGRRCSNRETFKARMWQSSNGLDWVSAAIPPGYVGTDDPALVGGSSFVLADMDRMWTSPDGESWTRTRPSTLNVWRIVQHDLGYLAYAQDEQDQWHALASQDGTSWTEVGQLAADGIRYGSVVAAGGTLVALGSTIEIGAAIVTSGDGTNWSTPQTNEFAGCSLDLVVTNGRTILVTGKDDASSAPAAWIASLD